MTREEHDLMHGDGIPRSRRHGRHTEEEEEEEEAEGEMHSRFHGQGFQGPSAEARAPMVVEAWEDPDTISGNCLSRAMKRFHAGLRARMRSTNPFRRLPSDVFAASLFMIFNTFAYVAGYVEAMAVAANTGETQYTAWNNGQSVAGLSTNIFGVFQVLTINVISRSDEYEGQNVKNRRVGKLFRLTMILAVVSTLLGAIIVLPFVDDWFRLRDKEAFASTANTYITISVWLYFFQFAFGVFLGMFIGCSKIVHGFVFGVVGIVSLGIFGKTLPEHMDPLVGAALASASVYVTGCIVAIVFVFLPNFRRQYGIFESSSSKEVPLKGDTNALKFFIILVLKNIVSQVVTFYANTLSAQVSPLEQIAQAYATTYPTFLSFVIAFGGTYQNMVGSRLAIRSRYPSYRFVVFFAVVSVTVVGLLGVGVGYGGALSLMGLPVIPKDIPPSYKDAAIANGQDLVGWVYAATILSGLTTVFHSCIVNFQYYWFYSISNFCFDLTFSLGGVLISQHYFSGDSVAILGIVPFVRALVSCLFYGAFVVLWLLPRVKKGDEEYQRRKKSDDMLGEPLLDLPENEKHETMATPP